ncbi:hypothetical protein MNBD_GAMMA22-1070 [hydrothermal vent metagenome]|uniref:Uncharacterized protein n=1 Tax=hydrothermal vent metagenome TaxID=652676 RepID=A0A3B1A7C9_9ZZZZ
MTSLNFSEVITWITVFLLVAAIPLTLVYFRYLNSKKSDSQLKKIQAKAKSNRRPKLEALPAVDLNFNFNNNWSAGESTETDYAVDEDADRKLAKILLKTIALNGESGMLIKQIADTLELHEIEVNYPLNYLAKHGFIEPVTSQKGSIYYLTSRGTAYCTKKGYSAQVA